MWFLEHESLFGGKRIWLRPGSQQLFGRTKPTEKDSSEGKKVFIDNKNVSRKHVMLKVHEVSPGNGTKLHTRSQVEITDLSCRQGTTVDGKQILKSQKNADGTIAYETTVLTGTEHTFRLSQSYPEFKITWQPTVITYASKENKESKERSARLHALDIKTTTEFMFDRTTHVASAKRNLPKVLSALVSGKHVVTSEFLEALLNVGSPSVDEAGNYTPSKLEEDFDTWWPKEKEYVPPVGAEPVPRPDQMLEPDLSRSEVFKGLTFVFLNEAQHTSLHEPISGGSGKALLYDVRPGETTVAEYVEYVYNVDGKKKSSKRTDGKLPVITVRLSAYPDGMEDWAAGFVTGTDQALNQRSILQNEFLDIIVSKDISSLQRPPAELTEITSSAPVGEISQPSMPESTPATQLRGPSEAPESCAPKAEEPVKTIPRKRPNRRLGTQSRFTGFDDYEPPPKVRKVEDTHVEEAPVTTTHESADVVMLPDPTPPFPVEESVEAHDQMAELFPAAAEMKRRRAVTRAMSASVEPETAGGPVKSRGAVALEKLQRAKKKADKEINVREQTRLRIKEEEERRKADEENLREALEGIDIAEIRGLAKIEEMAVKPRIDRPGNSTQSIAEARDERWNPEWNGRKNFKKFRRRGVEQGIQTPRVIVPLEEAPPKKGFGVNDAFFLEEPEPSARSLRQEEHQQRTKQKQTRVSDRGEAGEEGDSEVEAGGFSRRRRGDGQGQSRDTQRRTQTQSVPEVINVEDSDDDEEEEEEEEAPRISSTSRTTQRSSGRTQRIEETQLSQNTNANTNTQSERSSRKRGLGSSVLASSAGQPAAKRGKISSRRRDEDSDEEETGFRFRRRGR